MCIAALATTAASLVCVSAQGQEYSNSAAEDRPAAEKHPLLRHRIMIQAGVGFNEVESFAEVASRTGNRGTRLGFERHLGLASEYTSLDFLARWRFSERWKLEGEYFSVRRDRSKRVEREIQFGDHTFDVGVGLKGNLDIESYRLGLGYAFHRSHDAEFGVALSLYVGNFAAALSGEASLNGSYVGISTGRYSAPIPLPAIGLYGIYALSPKWAVSGRMDYVDLDVSVAKWFDNDLRNVGGYILSMDVSAEYRLSESIAMGVGYRYLESHFSAQTSGLKGRAGYQFSAPTAFVRVGF